MREKRTFGLGSLVHTNDSARSDVAAPADDDDDLTSYLHSSAAAVRGLRGGRWALRRNQYSSLDLYTSTGIRPLAFYNVRMFAQQASGFFYPYYTRRRRRARLPEWGARAWGDTGPRSEPR